MNKLRITTIIAAAALASSGCAEGWTADDRLADETPRSLEWTGAAVTADSDVCLVRGNERLAGQVETTLDGRTLIWYLGSARVEESTGYDVRIGESCGGPRFTWVAAEDHATDLLFDGIPVLRYVHPDFDPEDAEATMKPFHEVYSPDGQRRITKGLGGRYPHHRGIFFGYNQIRFDGGSADIWHAHEGEYSMHRETVREFAGPVFGGHRVRIDWFDTQGRRFLEETRTVRAFKRSDGEFFLDFESALASLVGDVELGGDNHHAGVQFRAAQYVNDNPETSRFLRPESWAALPADEEHAGITGLPWNAFQFVIEGDPYTVAYMSHPGNERVAPAGEREMSERLYGRFGEFIPTTLGADESLDFRYRFWVSERRGDIDREEIDAHYRAYAIRE